jgi:hypothetical protein
MRDEITRDDEHVVLPHHARISRKKDQGDIY